MNTVYKKPNLKMDNPVATSLKRGALAGLLVVEDNLDDLFFLKHAVSQANLAELTTFLVDGRQVIQYLAAATASENRTLYPLPKLILLDLAMPKATGFDVLKWMQTQPELMEVIVIVFTGIEDPRQLDHALELGAKRCCIKGPDVARWADFIFDLVKEFALHPALRDTTAEALRKTIAKDACTVLS